MSGEKTYVGETGGLWRTGARFSREAMDAFFLPKAVAVIGASEKAGSVGGALVHNLVASPFGGTVFPVNNRRPSVMGIATFPNVASIPMPVDLAVITTPASIVPNLVTECVEAKVKAIVIISAGFAEMGEPGKQLIEKIKATVAGTQIRIIGPNCLGIMNPVTGLNATFAATNALSGNLAFITQSGALGTTVLDWSLREKVGFSRFISIGTMMDVDWGDLIHYLGDDPETQAILIYMESIGNARSFMSAAREVSLCKPIIVIKGGRSAAAAAAAISHTGTLAGADDVVDAAFIRSGVLRVTDISELFDMAMVLSRQPLPKGPRLSIITNAGGPGVLATDALVSSGGDLAPIPEETMAHLNKCLPSAWSRANPIDILGDAPPSRYASVLETCLANPQSDGFLVILTPQEMTDPAACAKELVPFAHTTKPVLASWMGGDMVEAGAKVLEDAGIPCFQFSDQACKAFSYMWKYRDNLNEMYETPRGTGSQRDAVKAKDYAAKIIAAAVSEGRTLLTEHESKDLLRAYGIPIPEERIATTEDAAASEAASLGFPVVVKLHSRTITHKTDVGGVKLNLKSEEEVRRAFKAIQEAVKDGFDGVNVQPMYRLGDAYELIIGSTLDAQFGPTIVFGTGGSLVEVFKDRSIGLPPLNTTLARRMMCRTKIFEALKGVRGRGACDLEQLEQVLVAFSQFVMDHPRVKEIDLNPVAISDKLLVCLDARMVLHPPTVAEADLPKPAIRPYPVEYVESFSLRDETTATLRPVRPEDEPTMARFFERMSERSVKARFGDSWRLFKDAITHRQLVSICHNDYEREIALIVEQDGEILGVGRMSRVTGLRGIGLVGLIVSDGSQRQGVGSVLLDRIATIAKKEGIVELRAEIGGANTAAERLFEKFQFEKVGTVELFTICRRML